MDQLKKKQKEKSEEDKKEYSSFRIEIQDGKVFSGSLLEFEKNWFLYDAALADELKIASIALWAADHGWIAKVYMLH